MVKIQLQISCILESIQSLKTCDNYSYFLKLKCSNCGESSDLWHDFSEDERTNKDSKNPKGSNLSIKCKLCSRVNSMDVLEKSQGKLEYCEHQLYRVIMIVFLYSQQVTMKMMQDSSKAS